MAVPEDRRVIHSASNLRYVLLRGPLSLDAFRILSARCYEWCGWQVTFNALAVSHAVSLKRGDEQLIELLSCLPERVCGAPIVSFATEGSWEFQTEILDLNYGCRQTVLPLGNEMWQPRSFVASDFLEARYPAETGAAIPVTRIYWRADSVRLSIASLHTYPEEGRAVVTESFFSPSEIALDRGRSEPRA
jgi:hypothetical protein